MIGHGQDTWPVRKCSEHSGQRRQLNSGDAFLFFLVMIWRPSGQKAFMLKITGRSQYMRGLAVE